MKLIMASRYSMTSALLCALAACSGGSDGSGTVVPPVAVQSGISVVAGVDWMAGAGPGIVNGVAATARFNGIRGLAADKAGNYYVADSGNCSVRKITPSMQVSTLAGAADQCNTVDGAGSSARFGTLGDLTIDGAGNLYTNDGNVLRKIAPAGAVTTLAGNSGSAGKVDGTGTAASFLLLKSASSDSAGNVFVTDGQSSCVHRENQFPGAPSTLRTVSPAGVVTSLPYRTERIAALADGMTADASLGCVGSLAHDSLDNLYFVDGGEQDTLVFRKRAQDGRISTLPGVGPPILFAGNGEIRLAADERGNLFASNGFLGLFMITPQGVTTRIVGSKPETGDLLALPAGFTLETVRAVRYIGNRQLLIASDKVVFRITLP